MITLAYSCGSSKKAAAAKSTENKTIEVAPMPPPPPPHPPPPPPAPEFKQDNEAITAGKATFNTKCGKCHALKNTMDYTVAQWTPILDKMAGYAKLTDAEKKNVIAYVNANCKP